MMESGQSPDVSEKRWQYLEPRPRSWRKQLYVKGTPFKTFDIYAEIQASHETKQEAASAWNLPIEAIDEIIEYCSGNQDVLKRDVQEEHRRLDSRRLKISLTKEYSFPVLLFLIGVVIAIIFKNLPLYFIYAVAFILFLRFVNHIPVIGKLWVKIFGRQDLWEWLKMTISPLSLAVLGAYLTGMITSNQQELSVEKSRHDIVQNYLKSFEPGSGTATALNDARKSFNEDLESFIKGNRKTQLKIQENDRKDDPSYKHITICFKQFPESSWFGNQTLMALSQLTGLDTFQGKKTPQKRFILGFIHGSGLITTKANIISLREADMSNSDLTFMDLRNSCLESVKFADYAGLESSHSDLRHITLDYSDLSGANLRGANLRNASLKGVDLRGSASLKNADIRGADLSKAKIDYSTVIRGAKINTQKLMLRDYKSQWWYNFVCRPQVRNYVNKTFFCLSNIDYQDLNETKLPIYCNLPTDKECETLTVDKAKELGVVIDNSFPTD